MARGFPAAIDPFDCGCTECLTGEYVPLSMATPENLKGMLSGNIRDHTGIEFTYCDGLLSCAYGSWRINERM